MGVPHSESAASLQLAHPVEVQTMPKQVLSAFLEDHLQSLHTYEYPPWPCARRSRHEMRWWEFTQSEVHPYYDPIEH